MQQKISLPIDPYLDEILGIWSKHSTIIVKATPGSGKTTRLPWRIAQKSAKKVIVLEPRRLAAKFAAQRIAFEEQLVLGHEVGYHFRFEKKHQANSKLIFYTEGTFLKVLLHDFAAMNVGTVILDEFHERHIETDLALAALRSLQLSDPDLKIILMSATLDSKLIIDFPDAQLIEISAKQFNVTISYLPNQPSTLSRPLESKVKKAIQDLPHDSGDILVFLPGMREMLKAKDHLALELGEVYLLHGDLSKEEQEETLNPGTRRKIILATNIAESSITIPGIKVVIDSGIQREERFSPWTGLKSLEDRPITQSSAIQRAGRAGRTADGHCLRLYAEQDFNSREAFTVPEILRADLTDTYLVSSQIKSELRWFCPPPPERWEKARELLTKLGAISVDGQINSLGRAILDFPLGTRLARTLLAAEDYTYAEKKKLLHFICHSIEKDSSGALIRRLNFYLSKSGHNPAPMELAMLHGFIDQVAKYRRKQHDFIHYSGKTLKAHASLKDLHHEYYLILDITPRMEAFTIIAIEEEWLYEISPFPFSEEDILEVGENFSFKRQTRIGSIPLEETLIKLNWAELTAALKEKVLISGASPFKKRFREFQETETFLRLHFWARLQKHSMDEIEKAITLEHYLELYQGLSWQHLEDYFKSGLEKVLNITSLSEHLPLHINLGGKRDLKVHYPFGLDPFLEAPIQDFYGVRATPTIMKGQVPLNLKLLGPNKRPFQITRDIEGFWKKTYQQMKKEWQREYPRHHWPESPETARAILLKRQL
jgi:ATP-dependent helicase HrpB